MLEVCFDADGGGGVDKDASVLWCNDGLYDRSQIIDVWKGFDAKDDIVE